MKKAINKIIKPYSVLPLICVFGFNSLVYWGSMMATENRYHYDFTLAFDRAVPMLPEWVFVYLGCYLFWTVNYIMAAWFGKDRFYKFVTADLSSRAICLIIFLLLPTTNTRPEITGFGIAEDLMRWIYQVDNPSNLFPSIHCLVSWLCYIGIRGRKEISIWYRIFSCIVALAVAASTQFTKQHYIVDVFGGILLAELTWWMANHFSYHKIFRKTFENLNERLFHIV